MERIVVRAVVGLIGVGLIVAGMVTHNAGLIPIGIVFLVLVGIFSLGR